MKSKRRHKPKAIDLFCGCGGTTQGLKDAGYKVVWAIDNAKTPVDVYKANHKKVSTIVKDIRTVDCAALLKQLKLKQGELDLLAGCPPCQGFSSMRTKNGSYQVDDDRKNLVDEFYRFTEAFLPKAVMLENVPGLLDSPEFDRFLVKMEELGYQGEAKILNAKDYGVAQRRRRLLYVAGYKNLIAISETTLPAVNIEEKIRTLPKAGASGDYIHDLPEKRTQRIKEMIAMIPKDGGSRSDLPEEYILPCHKRYPKGFKDVYGRMKWDAPSPTITGGCASPSKGRFLHPEEDRCITLREAAILQGFPPGYIFPQGLPKEKLALMIGNALPAPFIKAHAKDIILQLS